MSFYDSTNNMQSGQSFTLDVKTENGQTTVSAPNVPDVAPVVDKDGRFAVQEMKRRLDAHVHQGFQAGRTPLQLGGTSED